MAFRKLLEIQKTSLSFAGIVANRLLRNILRFSGKIIQTSLWTNGTTKTCSGNTFDGGCPCKVGFTLEKDQCVGEFLSSGFFCKGDRSRLPIGEKFRSFI